MYVIDVLNCNVKELPNIWNETKKKYHHHSNKNDNQQRKILFKGLCQESGLRI